MKAVVQRVSGATVEVDEKVVGRIQTGLLVLVSAHKDDTDRECTKMADRLLGLRIFNDSEGKMNLAIRDVENSAILLVSNFTVYGETSKNRRPSFVQAAGYDDGERLFETLCLAVRQSDVKVETGIFGADMKVSLINDGPVTVILEVEPSKNS